MRRYYALFALSGAIVFVGLGILVYFAYLKPLFSRYDPQEKWIDLARSNTLIFAKQSDQDQIFGIELELEGRSAHTIDLRISSTEGVIHLASIKGNPVQFDYKNDWYDDSLFLVFDGPNDPSGKVKCTVRFLSIK